MNHPIRLPILILLLALAGFTCLSPSELSAEPEPTTQENINKKVAAGQKDKSLLDLYHEGGPVMHLIALCSVGMMALSGFCALNYSKAKLMPPALVSSLSQLMSQRDVAAAHQLCQQHPGPLSNALQSALVKANFERDMFNKTAMENAIADECFREETKMMVVINYLNTLAVMAPMIGLLGTVIGMISSFSALTAGKAEATELAGGIGEALVATAGGLLLAIPSMFLYFYFRGQAQSVMADVHKALSTLLDLFTGEVTAQSLQHPSGHSGSIPRP
ncbi:MAG: MotA/TolQ/ExbB proton channel family protein [Candidatus Methylacidiphilales bacterium]|nr:MotA/TolQ/ExbB proton channel family protein [Candidatus Methylacidiphilales bacterium]